MKRKLNKSQLDVLKEINDSVPRAWLNMLIKKEWAYPAIRKVVDMGLADPEVSEETKAKLETIKLSEEYSAQIDVIDEEIEKKIDNYLTMKVRQATKSGRLPPLSKEDLDVRKFKNESSEKETPKC